MKEERRPDVARGEVWLYALDPVVGSEQGKTRPCVVVQRDSANRTSPVTIVCPITDARNRHPDLLNIILEHGEGGTTKSSLVRCNQLRTLDRRRIHGRRLGRLSDRSMALIDNGLRAILDLGE